MENNAKSHNILIVEDQVRWQEIYEEALSEKYMLTSVKTLKSAESALDSAKFDIAIIDLGLDIKDPYNIDGIKIIKRLIPSTHRYESSLSQAIQIKFKEPILKLRALLILL